MSLSLVTLLEEDSGAELKGKDERAWEKLVDAEYKRIYNLHLRLSADSEIAADLTQETFVSAYQSIRTFRGNAKPRTWLYGVAMNCNRNWRRQMGRRDPEVELDDDLPDPNPSAEELAALGERKELIYDAVRRLPEPYRRTVALRYFAGLSTAEVASGEGVKEGTVRWRLHRAVQRLWIMLQPTIGEEREDERGDQGSLRIAH